METSLLDLVNQDQRQCLELCADLKKSCEREADEERMFDQFRTFKGLVMAQMKAEEYTLYALFDLDKKPRDQMLQNFALEAYEKHDLIEKILKDMGQAEESGPQWRAQLNVLTELLRALFEDESARFLPQVRRAVNARELEELTESYRKERDEIFNKRVGQSIASLDKFHATAAAVSIRPV